tara:strand:+ start:3622 stop:3966 length:345 start_codon:yes stop_codon:yes gene_type:complete
MPYVIEAKKRERNRVMLRYFLISNEGESEWVRKRFKAKAYPSERLAKQAKRMIGEPALSKLRGDKSNWKISIKSLSYQITETEMRELVNECVEGLVKRTGLTRQTIKRKLKERI